MPRCLLSQGPAALPFSQKTCRVYTGVDFVGLLVSVLDFKGVLDTQNDPSRYAGLIISAHSIFDHLKEATAREWTVVEMENDSE